MNCFKRLHVFVIYSHDLFDPITVVGNLRLSCHRCMFTLKFEKFCFSPQNGAVSVRKLRYYFEGLLGSPYFNKAIVALKGPKGPLHNCVT